MLVFDWCHSLALGTGSCCNQWRSTSTPSTPLLMEALKVLTHRRGPEVVRSFMQSPGVRRKAVSSTGQLPQDSTRTAPPQSTTSFGQVTTSGRKGRKGHETTHRKERILPLDTDGDASGRGSRELLSQLQRLRALQQEAQSLLT